jgi:predicted AAA+ superfamily ATPase
VGKILSGVDVDFVPDRFLLTGSARVLGLRALPELFSWSETDAEMFHYRTKDQVEVDVVLQNRRREVVALEVKASSTPKSEDFRGLRHLAERLGDDFLAGYVLYTGNETLSFGPKLRALPISALWQVAKP